MRKYRNLKIELNNKEKLQSIISKLKKIEVNDWKVNPSLCKQFAEKYNIIEEELVAFVSQYLKNLNPKSEKEVFAGTVYFGIKGNQLIVYDIISLIEGSKLPVHLYNIILQKFISDIIKPHPEIFGQTKGIIEIEQNKPKIPIVSSRQPNSKKSLVISANPQEFEVFDYRLKRPVHYMSRTGNGEALMLEGDEVNIGKKKINYFTPNNIGILLSVSNKSRDNAKSLLKEIKNRKKIKIPIEDIKDSSTIICDYIEQIQTSIVFTYTSIEAFVNLSIPKDYEYFEIKKEAGVHYEKRFQGDSIERLLPLKTKLKEILPDIYETDAIDKEKFFLDFDRLESLRNKIIHQKSIEHTELYKEYFKNTIFTVCEVANKLISFFYENCEEDFSTNPIWPSINGKEKNFPKSYFDANDFEVVGSINDNN